MSSPEKHLPPLGENPSTKDLLWQVSVGNMTATAVFFDLEDALHAQEVAKTPQALGYLVARSILQGVQQATETDSDVEISVGIEYFAPHEDITSREGEYRVLLSARDAEILLALDPFEFIEEGPLERR